MPGLASPRQSPPRKNLALPRHALPRQAGPRRELVSIYLVGKLTETDGPSVADPYS
jgi:hypothetical protein